MPGGVGEVLVGGQERQLVADAELGEQGIDCSDLHASAAARRAECGGIDMILSFGLHERQRGKAVDDLSSRLGPRKPLQQLLENEACRHDRLRPEQGLLQMPYLWLRADDVAP
jgi:hypothetical protein